MSKYKRLRRFLTITIAIILLTCVSFWGYIKYQQHASYQTLIPQNATALVRIDVYGIYKSMLREAINNNRNKKNKSFSGIAIPANVFCYTVAGKQAGTWFTSLPIHNISQWEESFKGMTSFKKMNQRSGIAFAGSSDGRWIIAFDKKRVAIAFSANKEAVNDVLTDILKQQNLIPVSGSKFASIKEEQGHITYLSEKNKGSLSFETGYIKASLSLDAEGFIIPDNIHHLQSDATEAASMWLFAGCEPLLKGKTFYIDTFQISGDSILKTNPRGIDLSIGNPSLQRDSIVTYEYNDDFEKVPVTTVQEREVPGVYLWLHADYEPLENYLLQRNIIARDSQLINKAAFPLYQLYTMPANYAMQISTIKHTIRKAPLIQSNDFFSLTINFEKLQQQAPFALLHPYIKQLRQLQANGTKHGAHGISIKAKLILKNEARSSLAELLDHL